MNFNVMDAFSGLLLLFVLLGLVFGIYRGFGKSVIRLLVVISMAVVAFFVTPPISQALLKANISGLGINIQGVAINSVQSGVVNVLKKISVVEELMGASPTFEALIEQIPLIFLNIILFFVVFLLLKWISTIISFILYKVILKKTEKGERKRFRLLGGLVGAVQGVIVFAVIMIPVFGLVNIADVASKNYKTGGTGAVAVVEKNQSESALLMNDAEVVVSENNSEEKIDEIKDKADGYVKDFDDLEFVKVFEWLGIRNVSVKVFNKFTTVSVEGDRIVLVEEVKVVSKIASKIDTVKNISTNPDDAMLEDLRVVVNTAFESKVFSNIVGEIVPYVAEEWSDSTSPKAFGVSKPKVPSEVKNLLDTTLNELKNATSTSLKTDLLQIVEIMDVASQNGLLDAIVKGKDSESVMNKLADEEIMVQIIEEMIVSPTLKAVLPEAMQTGLNFVFPVLDIPANPVELKQMFLLDIAAALKNTPALTVDSTPEEISDSKEEFLNRIQIIFDKYEFDLSDVAESNYENWMLNFSEGASSVFGSEITTEEIEGFFVENPFVSGENTVFLVDENGNMPNSQRKTADELQIDRGLSDAQWQTEKFVIAGIFSNIADTFNSLKEVPAGNEIEAINFSSLGSAFDGLRHSELFDDRNLVVADREPVVDRLSFNLVKSMLRSNLMSNINVTAAFVQNFEDNWDNDDFSFEESLRTLQSAVYVMQAFNNIDQNIDAGDMEILLQGLTGGSGEIISGFVSEEILLSAGVDGSLASAVVDVVNALAGQTLGDDVDYQAEADAMNGILQIMNSTNQGEFDETGIDSVIENLMGSTVLTAAIVETNNEGTGDNFGIAAAVISDEDAQADIYDSLSAQLALIDAMEDGPEKVAEKAKLDSIASMFGFYYDNDTATYALI